MPQERRVLVDVGMNDLPFPMRVASRRDPEGQPTVANISIGARIMHEYEAHWIDKFIHILHRHRAQIGTGFLRKNIVDYLNELQATKVRINFDYPFFVEKSTPVTREPDLIKYTCTYSAKMSATGDGAKVIFKIDIPAITTDPSSIPESAGGLFAQLSVVTLEVESHADIYAEDLVALVDRHALSPVFSFLTPDDQIAIIKKVHSEKKSSVVMTDDIKEELARNTDIEWYAVRCANYSMLHSYSTVVGTEKSMLIPCTCYDFDEL